MDWIAAVLRRIVALHPGRRRDQRRGRGRQRRRPALLERRGHDADAHARHPRDDARAGHGAHRQAGARLLGQRVGRGQRRHRRLRRGSWARTGRPSTGPRTSAAPAASSSPTTSTPTSCPASAPRAAPRPRTRSIATSASAPHPAGQRLRHRGRRLLGREEPGPKAALRRPRRDGRRRRRQRPPARAVEGHAEAETAVVWDARDRRRTGLPRRHRVAPACRGSASCRPTGPSSGPPARCSRGRRRRSRARINGASDSRPVVVLANLAGFDGSPESMRSLQLEYGAEIGRAIVNFRGPIVFCVISRYHGGAFVVFSKRLNDELTVLAVEGAYASVIGGAPAAAVVFSREVDARTATDPRVTSLEARLGSRGRPAEEGPAHERARRDPRGARPRASPPSRRSSTPSTTSGARSRSAPSMPSSPRRTCARPSSGHIDTWMQRLPRLRQS